MQHVPWNPAWCLMRTKALYAQHHSNTSQDTGTLRDTGFSEAGLNSQKKATSHRCNKQESSDSRHLTASSSHWLGHLCLFQQAGFQNNVSIDHKSGHLVGGFHVAVLTTPSRAPGDWCGH